MALEGYDLVMLGVLAAAALLGYFKGMIWQVAWIAGIVVSSFVALRFGGQLAPHFGNQAPWNRFAAMLACRHSAKRTGLSRCQRKFHVTRSTSWRISPFSMMIRPSI